MAISSRRNITFLCAFEPSEHLEVTPFAFELLAIDDFTFLVSFDLTLQLINLGVQSYQYESIIEAALLVIDASVYQHLVPFLQKQRNVSLSWARLVARIVERLKLGPDLSSHIVLVKIIEACSFTATAEYQQAVEKADTRMRISSLR